MKDTLHSGYGLGLALVATGLTGVLLLSVQGGIMRWMNRLAQYLGSAYLLVAAVAAARETGTWKLSLSAVEEAWFRKELLPAFQNEQRLRFVLRYGAAVASVAVAFGLRQAITARLGLGIPPYLLFMALTIGVMLFAGFGPGVTCILLTDLVVGYWILAPVGQFAIASPADRLGMAIYTATGVVLCAVVEVSRRSRDKAAAFDREAAVRETRERLATFAEATFEGIVENDGDVILDCNEQFARMMGYSVAELRGKEIAGIIAPEDRKWVMTDIRQGGTSTKEHAMLRKDGTRIIVEARGKAAFAGSSTRHTAIRDLTERKQVEAAAARYDLLSRHARDPLLLMETSGKIVEANQVALEFYGYSREALLDLNIKDLRRGDDAETIERQMQKATAGGILFETVHTCRDGKPVPVEVSSRGVTIEGRQMLLSVVRDITQRKTAEQALRASEERYRLLAETMLQGVVHQDGDGRIIAMNPAAERILGKTREQFFGSSSVREEHDSIRPDGSPFPGVEHPSMVALRTGQQVRKVVMGVFNPILGDYRWISIDAIPVFRPGETAPSEAYTVFEDITERKRAEEALRESRDRLDLALKSSRMAPFDWDILKDKRTWSDGVHRLLGTEASAFTGTSEEFFRIVHPEDRIGVQLAIAKAVETTGELETEYRAVWPDGSIRYVSSRGKVHRDNAGSAIRVTGVCWDITDQKDAEERLKASLREKEALLKRFITG